MSDRKSLSLPLLGLTIFAIDLFVILFSEIIYATNDDLRVSFLASGTLLSDSPSQFLLYPNILFGFALKSLYTFAPDLPWYFISLTAVSILTHIVISLILFRTLPPLYASMLSSLYLFFLLQPTFTEVALLAGFGGYLLFLERDRLRGDATPWRRSVFFITFLFLLASSAIIRFQSFGLISLVIAPILLYRWYRDKPSKRSMAPLFFVLVLILGLQLFSRNYYAQIPEWQRFKQYNSLKSRLLDYKIAETADNLEEALRAAEWTPTDFNIFKHWLFFDQEPFSYERVRTFVEHLDVHYLRKTGEIKHFYASMFHDRFVYLLLLALILLAIVRHPSKKKAILFFFYFLFLQGLFVAIALFLKAPPPRLYHAILYAFVILFGLYGTEERLVHRKRLIYGTATLFFGIFAILILKMQEANRYAHTAFMTNLSLLDRNIPYLSIGNALSLQGIDPKKGYTYLKPYHVFQFGTLMLSNDVRMAMKHRLQTDDFYRALFDHPKLRLLIRNDKLDQILLIKKFLETHYRTSLKVTILLKGEYLTIFRLSRKE